jgi:hypothetical protein
MKHPKLPALSLIFILAGTMLLMTIATNRVMAWQAQKLNASWAKLQTIEAQTKDLKAQKTVAQSTLQTKSQQVEAKGAELAKVSADLSAKLKQLDDANKKIAGLQSQLASTSAQIAKLRDIKPLFSFTVESTSITNVEAKKNDVKEVVTAAYDEMVNVYGKPYLLHQVTISFVDTLDIPGAYASIKVSNSAEGLSITIKIRDFDKNNFLDVNAIIHEVMHSFHGLALLDPPAYEEGEVVAATDVVMANLISNGKINNFSPLYIRTSVADYLNSSLTIPSDNSFYSSDNTGMYYQLEGVGWYELYRADHNFFKNFNEKLYEKARNGETVTSSVILQIIRDVGPATVQGRSLNEWLETKAFKLG